MATITIKADSNDSGVTLVISPMDALKLLMEYSSKYPNYSPTVSVSQFITKWVEANVEQADSRMKRGTNND